MPGASSVGHDPRGARWERRLRILMASALASTLAAAAAPGEELAGQPPLTVVSFGGALERSQMRAVIRPYRKASKRWVSVVAHDGGIDEIASQVRTENVRWDVVNLNLADMLRGCRQGLLEKIDVSTLPKGADGKPARDDFYKNALRDCGVGHNIYATVVAYDTEVFDTPPTKIADFFDTERFPGQRGLRRDPMVALEWALLADGVASEQIYPTLDTEKGVDRAFSVLDRIRDEIVWWTGGDEGPALIDRGLVTMGSAWNGRVHGAVQNGAEIAILWDAHVLNMDVWSIPRGSDRLADALGFIRFATGSEVLARQAREIPYGPARRSGLALVPAELQSQLPTSAEHLADAIRIDFEWWATNGLEVEDRFEEWLSRKPVYDFHQPDRN
jgi:putative spermidine/putrescine transport system substrate-binding protein